MPKPLRVAVVSVHPLTRAGLAKLLSTDPDRVTVVDTSSMDGHLAGHDVVVYDLTGLARTSEGDLQHLLGAGVPLLAVSPLGRPDLVEGALTLGVADVVPVSVTGPELLTAVERAAARPAPARGRQRAAPPAALRASTGLIEREIEILQLIASGLSDRDVAARLSLSINAVNTYIRAAYRKIGARSRSEAVLWAVRHHLVQPVRPPRAVDLTHEHGWRLRPPGPEPRGPAGARVRRIGGK